MDERSGQLRSSGQDNDAAYMRPVAAETSAAPDLGGSLELTDAPAVSDTPELTGPPETAVIRSEIEQTRSDLSETINAIQAKLAPDTLKEQAMTVVKDAVQDATDQAKDAVVHATVGKAERMVRKATYRANRAQSSLLDTIRDNPVPSLLAGLSLGWLYMNNRGGSSSSSYEYDDDDDDRYARSYRASYGTRGRSSSSYRGRGWEDDRDEDGKLTQAKEKAGELASDAREKVSEVADEAQYRVGRMADRTQERAGDLIDLIQDNPLPTALVGLGLGWMLMNRRSSTQSRSYPYTDAYSGMYSGSAYRQGYRFERDWDQDESRGMVDRAKSTVGNTVSTVQQKAGDIASTTTERVSDAASTAGGKVADVAGSAQERVGDVASAAQERVGDVASAAQERVSDFANEAQYRALKMEYRAQELVQEKPLLVGALAFALGAAAGLALPETKQERRMLGETREKVVEKAKEVAQDTVQKVQDVASEVKTTVTEEARNQGLVQ